MRPDPVEMVSVGQMATRKKKKKKGDEEDRPFLSDDMIINILSRLPIKDAMKCRLVCKNWRDLIMAHDFVDLYCTNRTPPTILVADSGYNTGVDFFSLDKWWEPARKRSVIHKFHSGFLSNRSRALFSHAGLTVFAQTQFAYAGFPYQVIFSILNPTTSHEIVHITVTKEIWKSQMYGVFFHPTLKEYCSLWNIPAPTNRPNQNNFKILILGSNPRFKTVSNHPFDHKFKFLDRNHYPVSIDMYLYWMLCPDHKRFNALIDIVEFSILSEEIRVLSCPFVMPCDNSSLLNIDGTLSCLTINPTNVTIWRMKHPTEQLWTSSVYNLNLERYCWRAFPIAVVEGKLVFTFDRILFVCDLMEGSVKKYQKRRYRETAKFSSHQMSLASVKNCKILIDQDGQLVVVR